VIAEKEKEKGKESAHFEVHVAGKLDGRNDVLESRYNTLNGSDVLLLKGE